ncbi:MAG: lytic transglycosylase domain-containing protein, partial [Bradyrhizobium sp.]
AAYNAGPGRYEDHLATGRPLPAETRAYVAALAPLLRGGGSEPGNIITAIIRSWTDGPLFPVQRSDGSTIAPPSPEGVSKQRPAATSAADWTGLAPQSDGLFARMSARRPRP